MGNQPLSTILEDKLFGPGVNASPTINQMLKHTEGRGLHLMMILLCLPFLTPVPIPGASSLLGAVIFLMALRLAFLLPPGLPDFIGERRIRLDQYPRQIRGSIKFLRVVERLIKPRRSVWLNWRVIYSGNATLIAFMAFLLALPVPLPFTNTLPAYTIILLAASMMEEDGVLIWLGYGVAVGALAYFGFISGSIVVLLSKS